MRARATTIGIGIGIGMMLLALTGCTATPAPTPTAPTSPFATEAEAFDAAEETYRAYVDAVNARRADPSAQPDPTEFLIGEALEGELEAQQVLDRSNVTIVGPSSIHTFEGQSSSPGYFEVSATTCFDSTQARVVDESGLDVTPIDRDAVISLRVDFQFLGNELLISRSVISETGPC